MKKINYKNFDWWVLEETSEYKKLLLNNCLNEKIIEDICENEKFDDKYMAHMNNLKYPYSWEKSNINRVLNGAFIDKYLDRDDLYDDVRLLTKEEVVNLPDEIKIISQWYWTISTDEKSVSRVWDVDYNGYLRAYYVSNNSGAVRPVIFIKNNDDKLTKLKLIQDTTNHGNLKDYLIYNNNKYAISIPQKLIIERLNKLIDKGENNER